jgi:predicted PurR-regulated permease PerM
MMTLLFPIYLYVFLKGLSGITEQTTELVPKIWRPKFEGITAEFGATLSAFFRGRLVVVFAMSLFTAVAFGITGLKFGVVLGIAIGLASIVPFLNLVFLVPALLIAALEFQSAGGVALILVLYAVGQMIDPILSPYLLSRGTGQHPVTVLVSLFVWGRLLGVVGLLLAVPLTAAMKILGRETVLPILADVDSTGREGEGG